MLSSIIGVVGALVALIGWFGFSSLPALVIGSLLYLLETALEWNKLNHGAKIIDIVIFIIGSIVAAFINTPFYIGGMVSINIYSAIMIIFSLPYLIRQIKLVVRILFPK